MPHIAFRTGKHSPRTAALFRAFGKTVRCVRILFCLFSTLVVAGCANHTAVPDSERDLASLRRQYDTQRTMEYPGVSTDQAIAAATRVFTLAHAGYHILAGRGGVIAWRERAGMDTMFHREHADFWYIDVRASGDGSVLRLRRTAEPDPATSLHAEDHGPGSGRLVAEATINPQETLLAELTESAAPAAIFFKRMDWLLGRNQYWLYCRAAEEYVKMEKLQGDLDSLCLGAGDKRP